MIAVAHLSAVVLGATNSSQSLPPGNNDSSTPLAIKPGTPNPAVSIKDQAVLPSIAPKLVSYPKSPSIQSGNPSPVSKDSHKLPPVAGADGAAVASGSNPRSLSISSIIDRLDETPLLSSSFLNCKVRLS